MFIAAPRPYLLDRRLRKFVQNAPRASLCQILTNAQWLGPHHGRQHGAVALPLRHRQRRALVRRGLVHRAGKRGRRRIPSCAGRSACCLFICVVMCIARARMSICVSCPYPERGAPESERSLVCTRLSPRWCLWCRGAWYLRFLAVQRRHALPLCVALNLAPTYFFLSLHLVQ